MLGNGRRDVRVVEGFPCVHESASVPPGLSSWPMGTCLQKTPPQQMTTHVYRALNFVRL